MEQQLERAVVATLGFGVTAVVIVAGAAAALECLIATIGCYLCAVFVQRLLPGRRVANVAWERRRLRELDRNLARKSTRREQERRPGRREHSERTLDAPFDFDFHIAGSEHARPTPRTAADGGYGW